MNPDLETIYAEQRALAAEWREDHPQRAGLELALTDTVGEELMLREEEEA
jgi:hypothetical protein